MNNILGLCIIAYGITWIILMKIDECKEKKQEKEKKERLEKW